ncbi:multisubunit sodium/proton antiporter MrpD subunit [Aliiruegeria haliotis]|uniref:Multisubunit sodium/proton antiporter MrpD subunit n=1 Tax=Aliiruegeria haliotis TaxID=1280846 RepID=A0A2T0RLM9_9RHOB|nr:proton-conducting transporter membrane subunit [Aliiruegeria haliotis]PRY22099.1 multisubunit sodium/proton antiporter MrpD subunit [Aliiruegeria haliotis]
MSELSLLVLLPFLAATLTVAVPGRAASLGLVATAANALLVVSLCREIIARGAVEQVIGGWAAPLGITFVGDGLAAVMLAMTAIVSLAITAQAMSTPGRAGFWPLWMATLGALNGLFLSGDLFNLYVAFEILGLAAVGLTALAGTPMALRAAFDYLTAGLAGSLLILLGIALSYSVTGRVDLETVVVLTESSNGRIALALIAAGLAVKAALFPLHFWMPAAHSSAVPVASALLSALVVKGALYLALRLSIEGGAGAEFLRSALAVLGTGGMLWGAWNALRAERLKLLVAHSTVAQIGLIALAIGVAGDPLQNGLWTAAALLMLSHALAKAAMFLAVGRIAEALGHDRISGLNREELRPGAAEFAFAIAAISLVGLPPTAGFIGKWILIEGLVDEGAVHWIALLLLGTALSAAYLSRVVSRCLRGGPHVSATAQRLPWRSGDVAALGLATGALLLGLAAALPLTLLEVPFA